VSRDDHAEGPIRDCLCDQVRQVFLAIGVGLVNMFDPKSFQDLADRDLVRDFVEISAGGRVILMPVIAVVPFSIRIRVKLC